MHSNGIPGFDYLTTKLNTFFSTNFLKKYFAFIGLPVILGGFLLVDAYLLPRTVIKDTLFGDKVAYAKSGGSFKSIVYVTDKRYYFATAGWRIRNEEVTLEVSPIMNRVVEVRDGEKSVHLNSGINGIFGMTLKVWAIFTFIAIIYSLIAKAPSENARLNMVFFQIIWLIITIRAYEIYG